VDRAKAVARGTVSLDSSHRRPGPAVVLIGPPGSGKSTVAATISRITGLALRDTDHDIEQLAKRTIPDIFIEDGEPFFRGLERTAVAAALREHVGVLALGGGAVLAPQTRALLVGHPVIFLNLSMPTGVRRTGLALNRPLLAGVNPRATYKALLESRLALYRESAEHEIDTDNLSVAEIARTIIGKLKLR